MRQTKAQITEERDRYRSVLERIGASMQFSGTWQGDGYVAPIHTCTQAGCPACWARAALAPAEVDLPADVARAMWDESEEGE